MKLRWEKDIRATGWTAYSNELHVGYVTTRLDGTKAYTVTGVHMKYIGKGYGDVKSIASGKRAVERAWQQWLTHAGLTPCP